MQDSRSRFQPECGDNDERGEADKSLLILDGMPKTRAIEKAIRDMTKRR